MKVCLSGARKWGNNTTQSGKGTPDHLKNSGNMNKATKWKCSWLGKIQRTWIMNENVTKKAGKDATYRDLVKIFKSWQVSDLLAKWIIMLRFMDLRWPRVFWRSNIGLVCIAVIILAYKRPAVPSYDNIYMGRVYIISTGDLHCTQ